MSDLDKAKEAAIRAMGWCHLNSEIALIIDEIIKLKTEVKKLKKALKEEKVVEDE